MGAARVVVLGGGYAGTEVARKLDKSPLVDVVVVDKREVQVHKVGALRAAVNPAWQDCVLVPRNLLLANGTVVRGNVKAVRDDVVALVDGRNIEYDYLVVATGAQSSSPGEPGAELETRREIKQSLQACSTAVRAAEDIVIVGGGVVGVELAGEIAFAYPDKTVTIVHAGPQLINSSVPPLPNKFYRSLKRQMDKMGIKCLLNERVDIDLASFEGWPFLQGLGSVRTASGKEIKSDLVFNCSGTALNSDFLPGHWLNAFGEVQVTPTLQVAGEEKVFALGDVTNIVQNKMAFFAVREHAPVVVHNVLKLVQGSTNKLKRYAPKPKPYMAVPLGPRQGVSVLPFGAVFGPRLTTRVKSTSLFLSLAWNANNLATPRTPSTRTNSRTDNGKGRPSGICVEPERLGSSDSDGTVESRPDFR